MLIKNTKPTLLRLGGSGVFTAAKADAAELAELAKHAAAGTPKAVSGVAGGLVLMPGVNEVDPEDWKEALKMATTGHMLKEGILELVGGEDAKIEGLSDVKENEALKIVRETLTKDLLEEWLHDEKRPRVKSEIERQLKKLQLPPVKKPGEDDDKPPAA